MNAPLRKKILFVITKSNWGGAQSYVYTLATHLNQTGTEVAVVFGGTGEPDAPSGRLAERLATAGVRTIFLRSFVRSISLLREWRTLNELVSIFKRERPDVVHLNSSKAGGLGALAARIAGVPRIIFTAHGWAHREKRNPYIRLLIWLASWATIILSHQVIVVSLYDHRDAPVFFSRRKLHIIHNGIDLHMSFGSGERIRDAFPAGAKITGTIGDFSKNKNHIALVEEARRDPTMYVALVGDDGPERPHLEEKIREYSLSERVKIFGFIPAREVLRGFDVFALPSLKEGLPYVLLEARAAGLPIVANRVGGVGEILDAKDMSEFSLERMVQKTLALYHS